MAYSVDIIYSKNADYSNPQTVSEAGQPLSIELTNLESDQAYYIKAVLKNNGVVESEDTEKFTTLSPVVDITKYFHITSDTAGVFTITRVNDPTTADLKYSSDGVNWTTADLSTDFSLNVAAGETVYMKGTNTSGFNRSTSSYYKMAMDVNHSVGGNIMSIVDEENYTTVTSIPNYCFAFLFYGDVYLVDAGDVNFGNVTSIGRYGCHYMYRDCTSLTTPSDISNITRIEFNGCSSMYYGCTSLTTPADISNVTSIGDYVCHSMYRDCASLTTPADLSNVTSIGNYGCYYMYCGCTSLKTPSDLSNVTSIGGNGCLYMYYGCTSLTNPSDLSKVTSIGNAPFQYMYSSCTSLSSAITPNISEWDANYFRYWLNSVSPTGVVYKPAGLEIPTNSVSGVPTGWTTQNY